MRITVTKPTKANGLTQTRLSVWRRKGRDYELIGEIWTSSTNPVRYCLDNPNGHKAKALRRLTDAADVFDGADPLRAGGKKRD